MVVGTDRGPLTRPRRTGVPGRSFARIWAIIADLMDASTYLAHLEHEVAALQTAVERGLDPPVPSCPGWTVGDLAAHVGTAQRWAAATVRNTGPDRVRLRDIPRPPEGDAAAAVEWLRSGGAEIIDALRQADPDRIAQSWAGDQPARFWFRRMALEAAVHRVDAEAAHGEPGSIDAELAVDGVDEFLDVFLTARPETATGLGGGETVHLHATDADGEWLLRYSEGPLEVDRGHQKGDAAMRGTASDLLLWVWNRAGLDRFEIFGDRALIDRWSERVRI